MKRILIILTVLLSMTLAGCTNKENKEPSTTTPVSNENTERHDNVFIYQHIDGLGIEKEED